MNKLPHALTLLLLVANLLVPQSVTSYRPCCYDQQGNLTATECHSGGKSSSIDMPVRNCCDPVTRQLRAAPAPDFNQAQSCRTAPSCWMDMTASPSIATAALYFYPTALVAANAASPPQKSDLITLHSRHNL